MSLSLAVAGTVSAQEQPVHVEPTLHVTAIEIVIDVRDAKGKMPDGLTPDDFVLLEEGVERKVIGIDYLRKAAAPPAELPQWQVLLYFDEHLSNAPNAKVAAKVFIAQVDELVRRGPVDVVIASPAPKALLRDSRDPRAVVAALQTVIARGGRSWIGWQREAFRREEKSERRRLSVGEVRLYVAQEVLAINQFNADLANWLSRYVRHVPRALFVIADGFDLDPVQFYGANLALPDQTELRTYVRQSELDRSVQHLSDVVAAAGWTTFGVLGNPFTSGWLNDASASGRGRGGQSGLGPKAWFYAPQAPLQIMADATGGSLVANSAKLGDALRDFDDRVLLTYQVPRPPDGKLRKIAVRSRRPGLKVRSVQSSASSTPDQIGAARVLGVMKEGQPAGDLRVESSFDLDPENEGKGTLRLSVPIEALSAVLPEDSRATFLVTIGVDVGSKNALIIHRTGQDDLADGTFDYRLRLDLPPDARAIVVEVEETSTGGWGATRVALQR